MVCQSQSHDTNIDCAKKQFGVTCSVVVNEFCVTFVGLNNVREKLF